VLETGTLLTQSLARAINSLAADPGTDLAELCSLGCLWIAANGVASWHDPGGITELGCKTPGGDGSGVPFYGACPNVS